MLGSLLEKKLKDLTKDKILIVMDDGLAFLGTLDDFDKNTIVLKEVYQGSSKEINWNKISEVYEKEKTRDTGEEETSVGFIDWTYVNMEEVYIRVTHISRIWRWYEKKEKEKEEKVETERTYKRPVYRKEHDIPNIGSSYDMPEGW